MKKEMISPENNKIPVTEETDAAPKIIGHSKAQAIAYEDDLSLSPEASGSAEPLQSTRASHLAPEQPASPGQSHRYAGNVSVTPVQMGVLSTSENDGDPIDLDVVMDVELTVTVEIGRKKRQLKDVLALRQGSIVKLDKQAGEPVDVVVNGQLIARGDVVVIDDNFGIRITEIVNKVK